MIRHFRRLTKEDLEQAQSSNGGYSMKQLKLLAVNTKKSGWKYRAMGKEYPLEVIEKFIALKDAHLVDGQNVFQRGEIELPKRWQRTKDPEAENERARLAEFDYKIRKPERLPPTEIENQIIWFTDLREELDKGNYKAVREAITGAISMLEREEKNETAKAQMEQRGVERTSV